jgi:hypothetical protein
MLANENKTVSSGDVMCTKCQVYKSRNQFIDSGSKMCNTCFKPYKEVLNLKKGDSLIYVSPLSTLEEEMIVVKEGEKVGRSWKITVKPISKKTEEVEGVTVFVKHTRAFPQGDKNQLVECHTCKKETPLYELEDNAKIGSYGFKMICNTCSDEIDRQMDAQQQDRA